jgi:bile acid:Na+ symporter, BASS family
LKFGKGFGQEVKWHEVVNKYFGIIVFIGLAAGFLFPGIFRRFSKIIFILLGAVITISFLTLDYKQFASTLKRFHIPLGVFIVYKIIIPVGLYYLLSLWNRNIALAALLLTATPSGMITPALSQLIGGDRAFVLALLLITSFTAPFYLPFLLKLIAGTRVALNPLEMMFSLAKLIFIPFVLSLLIRRWGRGAIEKTKHIHGTVSILLLFLIVVGVSAQGASIVRENWTTAVGYLGITTVFAALLAGFGLWLFWFLDRPKRFGLAISIPYVNMALTIVIAATYFSPEIVLFCVVYEVPANMLPVILRRVAKSKEANE